MWALGYAVHHGEAAPEMPKAVNGITRRLEKQKPSPDFPPLTLLGEVQEMADELGVDATLTSADRSTEIKGRKPS